jgi:hypothetical protein
MGVASADSFPVVKFSIADIRPGLHAANLPAGQREGVMLAT